MPYHKMSVKISKLHEPKSRKRIVTFSKRLYNFILKWAKQLKSNKDMC